MSKSTADAAVDYGEMANRMLEGVVKKEGFEEDVTKLSTLIKAGAALERKYGYNSCAYYSANREAIYEVVRGIEALVSKYKIKDFTKRLLAGKFHSHINRSACVRLPCLGERLIPPLSKHPFPFL
jgi:hypothetical protein